MHTASTYNISINIKPVTQAYHITQGQDGSSPPGEVPCIRKPAWSFESSAKLTPGLTKEASQTKDAVLTNALILMLSGLCSGNCPPSL